MTEADDNMGRAGAGVGSGAKDGLELCPLCSSVFSGSQHFIVVFSDALQPRRASPSSAVHGFPFSSPTFAVFQAQRHLNIALRFNQSFFYDSKTDTYLQLP